MLNLVQLYGRSLQLYHAMLATPAFVHLYCSRSTQDNCHFNTKFKYLEVLSMILVEWMTRVGHTKFSRSTCVH